MYRINEYGVILIVLLVVYYISSILRKMVWAYFRPTKKEFFLTFIPFYWWVYDFKEFYKKLK